MKIVLNLFGLQLIGAVATLCLQQSSVSAQSITPANDGTDTQINRDGNRYDIEGGSLSQDGENLFHSFEKFGLENGEIANFLSNPDIVNILGRVVGGDASIIHGLIQITGGNSNLFLMNPAGVIFGANATLNIPANLTVTTATGIQFGQNWFNAVGDNNYSTLIGTPSGYNFAVSQPGLILNEANLTLSEGSNLTFLGGTVINTGELSSPGGQITIAAVEGENLVRISQEGQLLNLEITPTDTSDNNYPITPLSMPQLLTGGESNNSANSVVVSNGQVILQNSDTIIPEEPGTTIAAGVFNVSDNNTGGTVNIFSTNSAIIESEINTTGENLSGNLFINSDNNITINQLLAETEAVEIIAAQDISFNQITTEGSLTAETKEGNINRIGENSLITANTVLFKTGETGSIGTVENPLLLDVDNIEAVAGSGGIFLETNSPLTIGNVSEEFTGLSTTGGGEINLNVDGDLTVLEDISTAVYGETNAGNITLTSSGDINITEGSLDAYSEGDGGNITLTAEGNITTSVIDSGSFGVGSSGDITLNSNSGEINTNDLDSRSSKGDGGNITLTAEGNITTSVIDSRSFSVGRSGDITLNSNSGKIDNTASLNSDSSEGEGGNITLIAEGNITTGSINSRTWGGVGRGGDITLNSNSGEINTTDTFFDLDSSSEGDGGNITLTAEGNITTGSINSYSKATGRGGDITLNSNMGEINIPMGLLDSSSNNGDGGNISIEAFGQIILPEINSSGELGTPGNLNVKAYSGNIILGEITSRNITITEEGEDNPFTNNNPEANLNSDANLISHQGGEVILEAHNDITLNQSIESDSISLLELRAGRNININANIDTSASNGDITLVANAEGANPQYRESGTGNIIMQPDTILNAGAGDIRLFIGSFGDPENIGDITIANLQTTGNITVDARGGNILSAANDSLITANSGNLYTEGNGAIASEINPLRLNINTLEGITGGGGAFFNSPNQGITITEFTTFNSGDIVVTAQGNIIAKGDIRTSDNNSSSSGTNASGNITLESINGAIDTTQGILWSAASGSNAGNITLTADGNITTGSIDSRGFGDGGDNGGNISAGDITLESINGAIDTTAGTLESYGEYANAGKVTLTANGNITTGQIDSYAYDGDGGDITLESTNGAIDTTQGTLGASSLVGYAGNVTLTADGNITTARINSFVGFYDEGSGAAGGGVGAGGEIRLESMNGEIDTTNGRLISLSSDGNGGNVTLTAENNIITGEINSSSSGFDGTAGNITLNSTNGAINTTGGILESYSSFGSAGNVNLDAAGHIEIQSIRSEGFQRGGNITIHSDSQNSINILGDIDTFSEAGIAGNITLSSPGNITTQNVTSYGLTESGDLIINSQGDISTQSITTQADEGPSGNIIVNGNNVAAGNISSIGTESAGRIEIEATDGSVRTENIRSRSSEGNAGGIDLEATEDINTGEQTVESEEGDSTVTNNAGNDVNTGEQTATTNQGDLTVTNTAGNDVNTGTQTATTNQGDSTITNNAGNDVNTGTQTATTNNGNANLENTGNNITTADQTATTQNGNASVNNTAENNINTDNQTVTVNQGNINIENTADNNINLSNQTATVTEDGNIDISNTAGQDINVNNQTATTRNGDANLNNTAGNNINANNQTLRTENGDATISNNAGNDINVNNQTATTENGNANISNTAGNDINVNNQTAITENGNASIENTAGNDINVNNQTAIATNGTATIENDAGGSVNVGNQTAIQDGNPGTIINREGNPNSLTNIQDSNSGTVINGASVSNSDLTNTPTNPTQELVNSDGLEISESETNRLNTIATETQTSSEVSRENLSSDSEEMNSINLAVVSPLSITSADAVTLLESNRNQEFSDYFGEDLASSDLTTENVRTVLDDITQKTGTRSAVVYVTLATNQLELVVFTGESKPQFYRIDVPRSELLKVAKKFQNEIMSPILSKRYIKPAQQLYDWLIRPLEAHLTDAKIDTILLSLDSGLRGLPIAAIHDGEQYLVEKYSLSLIPSMSLMNTNYSSLKNAEVLAMGVSEFTKLDPLPGVPVEIELITQRRYPGTSFINQGFTRENLINQRKNYPYSIIHLATHSDFTRKTPDDSYIQLWQNEQLKLNQLRTLGWQDPPVELLVLSSCRTAVGDEKAELGFAGLAVQAGVKTALASLWYVSDTGTLGLMSEFYRYLDETPIKAEALRTAQLAMIHGNVKDIETQLTANQSLTEVASPTQVSSFSSLDLSHPYYWSAFTMIGSPW